MFGQIHRLLVCGALLLALASLPALAAPGLPTQGAPPETTGLEGVAQALQTQLRTLEQLQARLRAAEQQQAVMAMMAEAQGDLERLRTREGLRERAQVLAKLQETLRMTERHQERLQTMLGQLDEAPRRALQLALAANLRVQARVRAQQRSLTEPAESLDAPGDEMRGDRRMPVPSSKGTPHSGRSAGGSTTPHRGGQGR